MSATPSVRRSLLALIPIVVLTAWSQHATPGITFKIRTQLRNHPAPEKAHPDSVAIKRREAAAAARADSIAASGGGGSDVGGGGGGGGGGGAAPGRGGGGAGCTGPANNVLQMDAAFVKGAGRFDVKGVIGCPELRATQSAIITDTSTLFVDDVQKNYYSSFFDIGSILAFTRAVDNNTKIGMLKISWDSLAPEMYEGRSARHFRLKMAYGFAQTQRPDSLKDLSITDVTSDYWVEDLPVNFENRFAGIGRSRRPVPDSLRGEWDKLLALYAQLGKGTIVKFQANGFIGINAPSTTEYTRTMEMTNIVAVDVDESRLKVPADFTKISPPGRGRGGAP